MRDVEQSPALRLKMRDMNMQVKNRLGSQRRKNFIRSTALYVFRIAEPFITIKTKCMSIAPQLKSVE